MISTTQYRACDVCRLLDYDTTAKECTFCNLCDAWICTDDLNKWGRRLKAFFKRKVEPGYAGLANYDEVAMGEKK